MISNKFKGASDGAPKFPLKHKLLRASWRICWCLLAAWTPVHLRLWRVFLLRVFGAKIGNNTDVRRSAKIWYPPNLVIGDFSLVGPDCIIYNMDKITIGHNTIISQGAYLCGGSHDFNDPFFPLITKPIKIGNYCWVAADAFVGPGVVVNEGSVLGARGVTFKNIDAWSVYVGNPAAKIKNRKNFLESL